MDAQYRRIDVKMSPNTYEFVGVRGFEPPTSCAQGRRSNRAEPHPENSLNT
jgi:hypothetical protein